MTVSSMLKVSVAIVLIIEVNFSCVYVSILFLSYECLQNVYKNNT